MIKRISASVLVTILVTMLTMVTMAGQTSPTLALSMTTPGDGQTVVFKVTVLNPTQTGDASKMVITTVTVTNECQEEFFVGQFTVVVAPNTTQTVILEYVMPPGRCACGIVVGRAKASFNGKKYGLDETGLLICH